MRDWYPGMKSGMVSSIREHIEIVEGAGGPKARIIGHQIRVVDVVTSHITWGTSVDQMVEDWPTITHADIYAALAYYYDNREAIDAWMRQDEAYVEEFKRAHGPGLLAEKLRRLRAGERQT